MLRESWQTKLLNSYLNRSQQVFLYVTMSIVVVFISALAIYHGKMRDYSQLRHDLIMISPFVPLFIYYHFSRNLTVTTDILLTSFLLSIIPGFISGGVSLSGAVYSMVFPSMVIFLLPFKRGKYFIGLYLLVVSSVPLLQFLGVIETPCSLPFLLVLLLNFSLLSLFSLFVSHRQEKLLSQLNYHIYFDPLTGFYNRHKLIQDLESGGQKALILINADNFKEINDILGYRTGDKIIKTVGEVLKKNVSFNGIYRLSGSEYAVIQFLSRGIDREEKRLVNLIQSILYDVTRADFQEGKMKIPLSVSIGAAFDREGVGANLMTRCDLALQEGKITKSKFCFYHPKLGENTDLRLTMSWDNQIESAFEENRILPFYQPMFNNITGELLKYECLVRLVDRNGAVHLPAVFLDIVRKKRLYPRLTRAVFRHAVQAAKERGIPVSVNIAEDDITDPFTREYLLLMLEQNKVDSLIQFEILETREIKDKKMLNHFLNSVRKYGCKVAIDDFGSGYSNFDYLAEIRADYVKIDGALIKELDVSREKRMLVENIVSISRDLGIKTVAEYVHTEEVFRVVKELGIDYSQGNHLGKPVPFSELSFSLRSGAGLPE